METNRETDRQTVIGRESFRQVQAEREREKLLNHCTVRPIVDLPINLQVNVLFAVYYH